MPRNFLVEDVLSVVSPEASCGTAGRQNIRDEMRNNGLARIAINRESVGSGARNSLESQVVGGKFDFSMIPLVN